MVNLTKSAPDAQYLQCSAISCPHTTFIRGQFTSWFNTLPYRSAEYGDLGARDWPDTLPSRYNPKPHLCIVSHTLGPSTSWVGIWPATATRWRFPAHRDSLCASDGYNHTPNKLYSARQRWVSPTLYWVGGN